MPLGQVRIAADLAERQHRPGGQASLRKHVAHLRPGPARGPRLDARPDDVLHLVDPVLRGVQARFRRPFGMPDDVRQLRELMMPVDVEYEPAVRGAERVHDADRGGALVPQAPLAEPEVLDSQHAIQHGDVQVLSHAGDVPGPERRHDADSGVQPAHRVAERSGEADPRRVVGRADRRVEAAHRLHDRRERRPAEIGRPRVLPESGDRGVDKPRRGLGELLVRQPVLAEGSGPEVLGEDIAAGGGPLDQGASLGRPPIDGEAPLVVVVPQERAAVVPARRVRQAGRRHPRHLTGRRQFDLDDLGAEARQDVGRERQGLILLKRQHPHPSQRTRRTAPRRGRAASRRGRCFPPRPSRPPSLLPPAPQPR